MVFYRRSDVDGRPQPTPAPPDDAHRYFPSELLGNQQPISPPSPSDSEYHHGHDHDHSEPDCAMSETNSHAIYTPYQYDTCIEASLTGLPFTATSNIAPWSSYNTRAAYDEDTLCCDECPSRFTGRYRNSNLARHKRQMHSAPQKYPCTIPTCSRSFQRPDARLKHERKKHPELMHPEAQRKAKRSEQSYRGDHSSLAYSVSDEGHPPSEVEMPIRQNTDSSSTTIRPGNGADIGLQFLDGALSPSAADFFAGLREKLDNQSYLRFCDNFFAQWGQIVEDLRSKGSDTYIVFAQALDALKKESRLDHNKTLGSGNECAGASSNVISNTYPYNHNRSHQGRTPHVSSNGFSGAASGRGTKRIGYNDHPMEGSASSPQVKQYMNNEKPKKKVDCPVHKYHVMHGIEPPCGGFAAEHMAQIRHHLDPSRSNRHGQFPGFLKRCSQCKEDVIDGQAWRYHVLNQCPRREQPRGDLIARWVRLYLTLYPGAQRVPIPYVDEVGWLESNDPQNPFLGDHPQEPTSSPPTPQSQEYVAALRVILNNTSTFRRSLLSEAARTLPFEERRRLADQYEEEYRLEIENLRRGEQSQPETSIHSPVPPTYGFDGHQQRDQQIQQDTSVTNTGLPASGFDGHQNASSEAPSSFAETVDAQPLPVIVNTYIPPSSVSTHSSSRGNDTGSSQPHRSSLTGSSSMPETSGPDSFLGQANSYDRLPSPSAHLAPPGFHGQYQIPFCPLPRATDEQMNEDLLMTGAPFDDNQPPTFNAEFADFNLYDDAPDPGYRDHRYYREC